MLKLFSIIRQMPLVFSVNQLNPQLTEMSLTSTIVDIEGWFFGGKFRSTFYSDNNVNSDNKNNNNDNKTDNNDNNDM